MELLSKQQTIKGSHSAILSLGIFSQNGYDKFSQKFWVLRVAESIYETSSTWKDKSTGKGFVLHIKFITINTSQDKWLYHEIS